MNQKKYKIAVVCPYFGKYPSNIELTFNSMISNKNIDWFIFTDNDLYMNKSNNLKIIKYSFDKLKKLIKDKIGTSISSPYKICDYKPTFGVLFDDVLKNYDFWGYCDLDAIYGKLSNFITYDILDNYDKIYDQGHLSLYKNIKEINEAFMYINSDDNFSYIDVLNSDAIQVFDESYSIKHIGINEILKKKGFRLYVKRDDYADLNRIRKNFHPLSIKKNNNFYFFEYYQNKIVLRNFSNCMEEKEFCYVHYQQKKNLPIEISDINHYFSTPKGFVDYVDKNDFYFRIDYQLLLFLKIVISRKIKKFKALINRKK